MRTSKQRLSILLLLAIRSWINQDQLKIYDSRTTEASAFLGTYDWMLKQQNISAWMRCTQRS